MAADLGKRLLAEVEEARLDEILLLLDCNGGHQKDHFGLPQLDRLVQAVTATWTTPASPPTSTPLVELTSLASGGGSTHLIYVVAAIAILPRDAGGKQACVVVVDADGAFSVARLATQLRLLLSKHDPSMIDTVVETSITSALRQVHIFRPQSLESMIATLDALPKYMFNSTRHYSFDRPVGFVAIDSLSAFVWQHRAESENAALIASTSPAPDRLFASPAGYAQLSSSLRSVCKSLNCSAVVTSWQLGPPAPPDQNGQLSRSLRPSLLVPWPGQPILRLLVRRTPVKQFPPGISVVDALREAGERLQVVEESKFECVVNEWGVNSASLDEMHATGQGAGFEFRITNEGVELAR